MHLISEIACLESLRKDGMDDFTFYLHVFILRTLVISTKGDAGPKMPVNADGSLSHKQLSKNITMAFRIAACIFVRNLAPRFNARQKFLMKLHNGGDGLEHSVESGDPGAFIPDEFQSGHAVFFKHYAWRVMIAGSREGNAEVMEKACVLESDLANKRGEDQTLCFMPFLGSWPIYTELKSIARIK
ncbi:transcriptional regulatory pro-1 [Fusarium coicis]|nr:transcriptional regulatory pro-1 [Fusarium coicis]